jgi:hypothetical protein
MMTKVEEKKEKEIKEKCEGSVEMTYEHTMWNRVFKEMSLIQALIVSMSRE